MCLVLCFACLVELQSLSSLHAQIPLQVSPTELSSEVSFWVPTGDVKLCDFCGQKLSFHWFGQNRAIVFVLMEHQSARCCITTGEKIDANL